MPTAPLVTAREHGTCGPFFGIGLIIPFGIFSPCIWCRLGVVPLPGVTVPPPEGCATCVPQYPVASLPGHPVTVTLPASFGTVLLVRCPWDPSVPQE